MADDDRKRELGSAQTTPAGPSLAAGSTLDMPEHARQSEISAGAMLGRFVLKRRLGQGGMGEVFAGEDVDLGRPVAIKVVRADTDHPAYHARLLREAQALARLEHPNVVRVYEVNSDHGRLFVAMELVDGTTLTTWLAERRSWQTVVAMFEQVGIGLAAVHHAGLVHRDFKPDNVLIDRDGKPRVADFGLARTTSEDASPMNKPLTRTGAMMGTPGYMAPEQQFGGDVDARADQYSFCVALREALGGRPLDEQRWQLVPRGVRDVIARGLGYDPEERYVSMPELLAALRRGTVERDQRWIAALMVLVVLGAVAGIVAYVSSRRGEQQPAAQQPIASGSADAALVAQAASDAAPIVREVTPADAAVVIAQLPELPPVDAGAVRTSMPGGGRDAGVRVAQRPALVVDAGAATAPDPAADAGVPHGQPIMATVPTSKHLPVAQVGDPGHLPALRTAIRDLGYDGVDIGKLVDFERDAKAELDGGERVAAGIAHIKLGIVARRKGDCAGALTHWADAKQQLKVNRDGDEADKWLARAALGTALCELGSGKAETAKDTINTAWVHGDRDEVALVMGMIAFERGEKDVAYGQMLIAERKTNPRVQAALKQWLDGFGFGLR